MPVHKKEKKECAESAKKGLGSSKGGNKQKKGKATSAYRLHTRGKEKHQKS